MAKKSERPSVVNMSYIAARRIIHDYNENNETYLRRIVRNHIPDAENILACSDRKYLLHMTRTINGVAKRVNNNDKKILENNPDIFDKIKSLAYVIDAAERELLDERICLQLEGRNIPEGCLLSNAYTIKSVIG
jgi:hypothetical protein